jgi:hypothetical protein
MSIISDEVFGKTRDRGIEVFYVPRAATKWWNARRKDRKNEIALLGGWYWTLGREEHGPFRSQSAAWRDAFYRRVLKHAPPMMDAKEVKIAELDAAEEARKQKRRARRPNLSLVAA